MIGFIVRDSVPPAWTSSDAAIPMVIFKSLVTHDYAAFMYAPHQIAVVDFNFVWVHLLSLSRWQGMSKRDHKVALPSGLNTDVRAAPLSGCSERGKSVGANPLHHGTEAIRALRREMFAQTHAFE
jgi:hypothetical protein